MQPIAQAVLLETFPVEKRGTAMAAYGMGVVVAPIIGPTLGGWITYNYAWRRIFYINLPVGVVALSSQPVRDRPAVHPGAPRQLHRLSRLRRHGGLAGRSATRAR